MSANGMLRAWWAEQELAGLSDAQLSGLGRELARCQNSLAGMVTQLAREAQVREAAGASPPADETLTGAGDRSLDEADQAKDRAGVANELPVAGAGIDDGTTSEANANALGHLVAQLTATELQRLKRHDRTIQARMGDRPELFARWLAALARLISDPPDPSGEELSTAERAKAEAGLWLRRRPDGTWELRGHFDPERGSDLDRAIAAYARDLAGSDTVVTANDRAAALHSLVMQHGDGLGPRTIGIGYLVDVQTGATEDWAGDPVDPRTAARRSCDADVWVSFYDRAGHPQPGRTNPPVSHQTTTVAAPGFVPDVSDRWSHPVRSLRNPPPHPVRSRRRDRAVQPGASLDGLASPGPRPGVCPHHGRRPQPPPPPTQRRPPPRHPGTNPAVPSPAPTLTDGGTQRR